MYPHNVRVCNCKKDQFIDNDMENYLEYISEYMTKSCISVCLLAKETRGLKKKGMVPDKAEWGQNRRQTF